MSDLLSPCTDCGELTDLGAYCSEHQPPAPEKAPAIERGYDYKWRVLSRRARALQPFCSQCGTTEDLTTDHSPEAWQRKARGLPIRLQDVDVLCRSHNSIKGAAR